MSERDVDLDRLADYAAGLLDPAQAAAVEHLLASEPAWAETLTALTAAQPRVQAALAELAAPPVPDDVVARLTAVIPQQGRDAAVVDLSAQRQRRRRWPQVAAGVAAAAAVAAVCIGGLNLVRNTGVTNSSSGAGSADRAAPAAAPPVFGSSAGPSVLTTGTDYTAQTVTSVATRGHAQAQAPGPSVPRAAGGAEKSAAMSGPLSRLAEPAELQTCLNLVAMAYSRTPTVVDYARYEGRPAVVVVLSGSGTGEVVVVGPDCGLPATGTDQIYAAPLR